MHQIKIFKGSEGEVEELETSMNTWLRESSARVVNIFGNISLREVNGAIWAVVSPTPISLWPSSMKPTEAPRS